MKLGTHSLQIEDIVVKKQVDISLQLSFSLDSNIFISNYLSIHQKVTQCTAVLILIIEVLLVTL